MNKVYGWDRKTDDTVILYENDHLETAIRWAKGYVDNGDMGGWDKVYVSYLYQIDVDWEGEPVYAEHVPWTCWQEPMDQPVKGMDYPDNAMEEF